MPPRKPVERPDPERCHCGQSLDAAGWCAHGCNSADGSFERERDGDDGVEYGDPRDYRDGLED